MPDTIASNPSPAPASAPPPSAPASSSTPSPSAPSSAPASTAPVSVPKARTQKEVMERAVERHKAKEAAPSTSAPDAVKSEESVTAEGKQTAPDVAKAAEAPEDAGLPEKLPDLKPGELPEVPRDIRQALNAIQDKKVREQIARLTFMGKGFAELRMTPQEGAQLRQMYPTLQVAQQAHTAAGFAYSLAQAYHSNTPEGFEHFVSNLRNSNANAYTGLVNKVTENLFKENPQAYRKVANQGLRAFIANLRQKAEIAERNGDAARAHEYTTAALINEEAAFPKGMTQPQQRPANDPLVQQVKALELEKSNFMQQRQQASYQNVVNRVEADVTKQALAALKQADPDNLYPEKGRDRLVKSIVEGVRERVRTNPHVGTNLTNLINQGNEQGAAEFLINQAQNHLGTVAAEALNAYAQEFGAIQQARQAKLQSVVGQKDVGSAGPALPKGQGKVVITKGMTTQEKIMAFAKAKMKT